MLFVDCAGGKCTNLGDVDGVNGLGAKTLHCLLAATDSVPFPSLNPLTKSKRALPPSQIEFKRFNNANLKGMTYPQNAGFSCQDLGGPWREGDYSRLSSSIGFSANTETSSLNLQLEWSRSLSHGILPTFSDLLKNYWSSPTSMSEESKNIEYFDPIWEEELVQSFPKKSNHQHFGEGLSGFSDN